jgi:hypothetical protein
MVRLRVQRKRVGMMRSMQLRHENRKCMDAQCHTILVE